METWSFLAPCFIGRETEAWIRRWWPISALQSCVLVPMCPPCHDQGQSLRTEHLFHVSLHQTALGQPRGTCESWSTLLTPVPAPRTLGHFCKGAEEAMLIQDAVKMHQFTQDSDSTGSRRAGGSLYLLTFPSASQTPSNSTSPPPPPSFQLPQDGGRF